MLPADSFTSRSPTAAELSPAARDAVLAAEYPITVEGLIGAEALRLWRSMEGADWMIKHRPSLHPFGLALRDHLDAEAGTLTLESTHAANQCLDSLAAWAWGPTLPGDSLGRLQLFLRRTFNLVARAVGAPMEHEGGVLHRTQP